MSSPMGTDGGSGFAGARAPMADRDSPVAPAPVKLLSALQIDAESACCAATALWSSGVKQSSCAITGNRALRWAGWFS